MRAASLCATAKVVKPLVNTMTVIAASAIVCFFIVDSHLERFLLDEGRAHTFRRFPNSESRERLSPMPRIMPNSSFRHNSGGLLNILLFMSP
jgi:hypothetical protein